MSAVSLSLSVSLYLSLSLPFLSLSLSLPPSLSIYIYIYLSLPPSPLCLSLPSLSASLPPLSFYLSLPPSLSLPLCLSLSPSPSLSLYFSPSLAICLSLLPPLSLCLPLSLTFLTSAGFLAETLPFLPVSGPFLPHFPPCHVPPDSVFPSRPWSPKTLPRLLHFSTVLMFSVSSLISTCLNHSRLPLLATITIGSTFASYNVSFVTRSTEMGNKSGHVKSGKSMSKSVGDDFALKCLFLCLRDFY